jgi:hypothetical protein
MGQGGSAADIHNAGSTRRTEERQDAGVEGNARLTAMTGALLFVLLAAEGLTIVRIGPLLKVHVFLGALIVPPVVVKLGATIYRFGRYYSRSPGYRRKGPPPLLLRLLGPALVVLTVVLFASGILLLFVGAQDRAAMLLLHRASFILWFAVMSVHVVGHFVDVVRRAPRDFQPSMRQRGYGSALRQLVLVGALAAGGPLGATLLGRAGHYYF